MWVRTTVTIARWTEENNGREARTWDESESCGEEGRGGAGAGSSPPGGGAARRRVLTKEAGPSAALGRARVSRGPMIEEGS